MLDIAYIPFQIFFIPAVCDPGWNLDVPGIKVLTTDLGKLVHTILPPPFLPWCSNCIVYPTYVLGCWDLLINESLPNVSFFCHFFFLFRCISTAIGILPRGTHPPSGSTHFFGDRILRSVQPIIKAQSEYSLFSVLAELWLLRPCFSVWGRLRWRCWKPCQPTDRSYKVSC